MAVSVGAGVALMAGLALLLAPPAGTDLSAQQARASFAGAHPGTAIDFRWYGGVAPAGYSLIAPYLEAALGVRLTGVLAATLGGALFAVLMPRWRARYPVLAAAWGALAQVVNLASGRTAFALGVTAGLSALTLIPAPAAAVSPARAHRLRWIAAGATPVSPARARRLRWMAAGAAATMTGLTSPVAALFLALVAVVWAIRQRSVAWLSAAAILPVLLLAAAFGAPGRMPFSWAVAWPVLLGCAAVLVCCRGLPVRIAAAGYLAATAITFAAPGPLGSNIERLALLFTGAALLAASWLPRVALALAVAVAAQWTARDPVRDLSQANSAAAERATAEHLVDVLRGLGPPLGRIEVVPFRDHSESAVVAQVWPLARGWERQVDEVRAAPLYRDPIDPAAYKRWLRDNAVQYVALGIGAHDWSTAGERALLAAPPPFLAEVYRDSRWTVWRVTGFRPLVGVESTGQAVTPVLVAPDRIAVDLPTPLALHVAVRWSRWLTVTGPACIRPDRGETELVVTSPGPVVLSSSLANWFGAGRCGA